MDELIVPGSIALVILYAGLAIIIYGVLLVFLTVFRTLFDGNLPLFGEMIAAIAGAIVAYVLIGLWLRRIELI